MHGIRDRELPKDLHSYPSTISIHFFFKMLGVSGDKIDDDDDDYIYHDSTDSKMWQGSLPHKNI